MTTFEEIYGRKIFFIADMTLDTKQIRSDTRDS